LERYRPDWDPTVREKVQVELRSRALKKDSHFVESFRYATGFNQQ
jgi:hypothetical protein